MKRLPIHVRLTAWYLLSLAVIITLFAMGSWYAMRVSLYRSIDRDLEYRMEAVVPFIVGHALTTRDDFDRTFANSSDSSIVGVLTQVTDARSQILYESDVLVAHGLAEFPYAELDGSTNWRTVNRHGWPIRVANKRVIVDGVELTVHVVEPLRDVLRSLSQLTVAFVLLVPIALLLTATAGYWISRRALAPVEQIRREAEAIDPTDLTARLQVPRMDDELGRLALTLNSMLTRIETGFRSVERFTADASHELRAPLAFMITAGDVSLRRPRTREELADVLGKVIAEARRMSKLVEDLLALARGDVRHLSLSLERVDLTALLAEAADQLSTVAADKQLVLELSLPSANVYVNGMASDLRRLFMILLDNAIKYTDHGTIRIALAEENSEVVVIVSDSGIGIESGALPHIFDRFWRADKVRSRAEGGVGLGLSLAAQIAQRHHGTISVESVLGEGSAFAVRLKRSEAAEELAFDEAASQVR